MRFRHLLSAALLCGTVLSTQSHAGDWPTAGRSWGQLGGSANSADAAAAHAYQRNGAIQAKQGRDALMSGGSYSNTTAGVINSITTNIQGDGNGVNQSGNGQDGTNSGKVKNQTQFNRNATNLGN